MFFFCTFGELILFCMYILGLDVVGPSRTRMEGRVDKRSTRRFSSHHKHYDPSQDQVGDTQFLAWEESNGIFLAQCLTIWSCDRMDRNHFTLAPLKFNVLMTIMLMSYLCVPTGGPTGWYQNEWQRWKRPS